MPALMKGKRSSISSLLKYSSIGASAPCLMKRASWKESTAAQSGAPPCPRLFQHLGMFTADIRRVVLDVDLPLGMFLGKLLVELCEALGLAWGGAGVGLVCIDPERHGVRRVGAADAIGGHELLRARPAGEANHHRRSQEGDEETFVHVSLPVAILPARPLAS